jgi:hypothetical protein
MGCQSSKLVAKSNRSRTHKTGFEEKVRNNDGDGAPELDSAPLQRTDVSTPSMPTLLGRQHKFSQKVVTEDGWERFIPDTWDKRKKIGAPQAQGESEAPATPLSSKELHVHVTPNHLEEALSHSHDASLMHDTLDTAPLEDDVEGRHHMHGSVDVKELIALNRSTNTCARYDAQGEDTEMLARFGDDRLMPALELSAEDWARLDDWGIGYVQRNFEYCIGVRHKDEVSDRKRSEAAKSIDARSYCF